jgi:catechol 2,3-dioxygenase-like lactoylglutathione lyase family enzyme
MTTSVLPTHDPSHAGHVATLDMKLEVVTIPVSDVDRAKAFYAALGWRLDADFMAEDGRVVQFTPPASQCSIHIGRNITSAAPGSVQNVFLIVPDIQVARDELEARGVAVSEVFHHTGSPTRLGDQVDGLAPERRSYGSYASFRDPDGNGWLLQEVTTRFPGRLDPTATSFASVSDLTSALRRAFAAGDRREKRTGERQANPPEWYAMYLVAEQAGTDLPF